MAKKSQLKYEPEFSEKISRLFIFRFLWIFPLAVVVFFWSILISVVGFLHFWYMLILGERHKKLWTIHVDFIRFIERWNAYFGAMVDERPNLLG